MAIIPKLLGCNSSFYLCYQHLFFMASSMLRGFGNSSVFSYNVNLNAYKPFEFGLATLMLKTTDAIFTKDEVIATQR